MKNAVLILPVLFLSSCACYRYKYRNEKMEIVAKHLTSIFIVATDEDKKCALFKPVPGKESNKVFSLINFSPDCWTFSGNLFKLEPGKHYSIDVGPSGDCSAIPLYITVLPGGQIAQIKNNRIILPHKK